MTDQNRDFAAERAHRRWVVTEAVAAVVGTTLAVILIWGFFAAAMVLGISLLTGLPLSTSFALAVCAFAGIGVCRAGFDGDCSGIGAFAAVMILVGASVAAALVVFAGISLLIAIPLIPILALAGWVMSFFTE